MGPDEAPFAYAAIQKAVALAPAHATPIERALIQAMAARYVERFDPAKRVEQDRAYADAMKKVVDAYPDDLDAATLYAEALFLLEPRRGRAGHREPERPADRRRARARADQGHPPSRRVSPVRPRHRSDERARAAPPRAPNSSATRSPAPATSTTCPRTPGTQVGRWGDAVRASLDAWHSDLKSLVGEGFAIYP